MLYSSWGLISVDLNRTLLHVSFIDAVYTCQCVQSAYFTTVWERWLVQFMMQYHHYMLFWGLCCLSATLLHLPVQLISLKSNTLHPSIFNNILVFFGPFFFFFGLLPFFILIFILWHDVDVHSYYLVCCIKTMWQSHCPVSWGKAIHPSWRKVSWDRTSTIHACHDHSLPTSMWPSEGKREWCMRWGNFQEKLNLIPRSRVFP